MNDSLDFHTTVAGRLALEALEEFKSVSGINFCDVSLRHSTLTNMLAIFCDSEGQELARVNFRSKHIVRKKHKLKMKFPWEYLTQGKVKSLTRLSEDQLCSMFGDPILVKNPVYATASPMKLYPKHWVI